MEGNADLFADRIGLMRHEDMHDFFLFSYLTF